MPARFPAVTLAAAPGERRAVMLRGYDHLAAWLTASHRRIGA
ncbi:hypothetical protein [Micromonospora aurantiaca (nom. illeg.)]